MMNIRVLYAILGLSYAAFAQASSSALLNGVCYTCPTPAIIAQESNGVATCDCVDASGQVVAGESCTVSENPDDCSDYYDSDSDSDSHSHSHSDDDTDDELDIGSDTDDD